MTVIISKNELNVLIPKSLPRYLKILRPLNLIIIILTLFMLRYVVIKSILAAAGAELYMPSAHFNLIVFCTILIAAYGYMVNDLCDVEIDLINDPGSVYIPALISKKSMVGILLTLGAMIFILILMLSIILKSFLVPALLLTAFVVTNWYAFKLKKSFVWGNLAVASMTAGTLIMASLPEINHLAVTGQTTNISSARLLIINVVAALSIFAFLLNFAREIVKDIEDIEGDRAIGCKSIPIVKGIKISKIIVFLIVAFTLMLLILAQSRLAFYGKWPAILFLAILCEIPILVFISLLQRAAQKPHFHNAGNWLKFIMLCGILSLLAAV